MAMSARPRVFITKRIFPEAVEFLQRSFDVDYNGTDRVLPADELVERARGCQALVSQLTDRLDAGIIGRLEGLRIIANVAVGYDNIDVAAATARGIAVTNTPGVLTETTADFAFALLMAAARRIPEAHAFVHSGQWRTWIIDLLAGQDVYGATLGIFGLGRIGAAVARRGRGFGMRILYCDEQPAPPELERELDARRVSKEELLRESDFVSLHVPLTPATRHLISRAELALMKPTAILVNTARGPVVDEEALVEALERRIIWAAGLDVFENEPAVHPKLLELPNVVLAPHIASASYATRRRMSMMAAENAAAALAGKRPPNLLNPEAWPEEAAR
jgi:lactate dehydrogenase-like 2-hydroxyacid dehydrogenase